jgi:hypothetical protein
MRAVYRLPPGQTMKDVLAMHADLLRSEGAEPPWSESDSPSATVDRRSQ